MDTALYLESGKLQKISIHYENFFLKIDATFFCPLLKNIKGSPYPHKIKFLAVF